MYILHLWLHCAPFVPVLLEKSERQPTKQTNSSCIGRSTHLVQVGVLHFDSHRSAVKELGAMHLAESHRFESPEENDSSSSR